MGGEWEDFVLEDIAEDIPNAMSTGPFGSAISSKFFESEGVPVIRGGNLSIDVGIKMSDNGLAFVSEEKAREFHRSVVRAGDLIFTCWGTINQVGLITDKLTYRKYIISNKQMKLTADQSKADPLYLYYLFSGPVKQVEILQKGIGAAVPGFNLGQLKQHVVRLPSIVEQRRISNFLSSFDNKIELNQQMNKTLESMAQALFKSWFVDFDPVIDNALASGKEIPEELREKAQARAALGDKRKPLPVEIRSLFPDEFVYSDELGWIPEGWDTKTIDEAIEVNPRVKLKKEEIAKFVDMKALPTTGFSVANISKKPYAGGAKFNTGDVLLARITPCLENGKTGVADFLEEGEVGFGSTEFIVLRGKGAIQTPFVACLARDPNFRRHCIQSMVGSSGRQRVQNACFSYFHLALPPKDNLLRAFNKTVEGAFEKFVQHREQSKVLVNLRDTLLPKLLSGEIRIPDAEKMVEELE